MMPFLAVRCLNCNNIDEFPRMDYDEIPYCSQVHPLSLSLSSSIWLLTQKKSAHQHPTLSPQPHPPSNSHNGPTMATTNSPPSSRAAYLSLTPL